jgi:hypothetical protein
VEEPDAADPPPLAGQINLAAGPALIACYPFG